MCGIFVNVVCHIRQFVVRLFVCASKSCHWSMEPPKMYDSFVSCFRSDMALFQIEFYVQNFAYLSSLWRSTWSTAVFVLGLRQ